MIRGISLRGAVSLNVITMIGIGPLITIPLVLQQLAGPLALAGWVAGAIVALCDGLVWAELGSKYPGCGGTYAYLRDIFGAQRWGRMLAFLYNWQYFLAASLIVATGYIGFADYAGYLYAPIANSYWLTHAVALAVGVLSIALVYRRITAVANFGFVLACAAMVTIVIVGIAGFSHGDVHRAFTLDRPVSFGWGFIFGFGSALYIALYDYLGYAQVACVGEEVEQPQRTLPLSIVASILVVLALYLFLQVGVLAGIPWQTMFDAHNQPTPQSQFVGSTVIEHAWGAPAAIAVTLLVLITAFASLYGNLAGAARVPFAAARDGAFVPWFAALHPKNRFPHVALLGIGAISLAACFFSLGDVIAVLTAAGIVSGSIAQIAALFVMRARGERAPFRMWLYPLPVLIALAGWIYAFVSTGEAHIALGGLWLAIGVAAFLVIARVQRAWPFAAAAFALAALLPHPTVAAPSPPFLYGAAFFYERIPRSEWEASLAQYRSMGINTIDLYVMWNWHELRDGDFDFTGRTNPRRDLAGLLALVHRDGFKLVFRPGPVIRNEWRNGGYPAWLLKRPEYNMPLRDILEGRYPATATFQNTQSDAAAAEWMNNRTHMRYASRWLRHVFAVARPWRSDIIAVALDDDQGAYIENDTWPGTHFHRYINYLASLVHAAYGPAMPVFINTYQMKVTASAPVWAWGNWYQSDAYSIGEHDRAQIEFSTGLLETQQPARPVMVSEFQAGWLQVADQPSPRSADPSNTTLALHTFLQMGAHGVINFPVQDTLNPSGWEAPWTNAFYSWDAALAVQLTPQARWPPTARFGALMARYGSFLTQTHPAADAAIAYMTSAYAASQVTNSDVDAIAAATVRAQESCRTVRITCAIVDLRYNRDRLGSYRAIIIPKNGVALPLVPAVAHALAAFRAGGGRVVESASQVLARPAAGGIPSAVLLVSNDERYGFLDVVNYGSRRLRTKASTVRAGRFSADVPALTVAPRDALLLPLHLFVPPLKAERQQTASTGMSRLPLRPGSYIPSKWSNPSFEDGYPQLLHGDGNMMVAISPCAGARAFVFADSARGENLFTTVGGLRDAWTPALPPSQRDYIAKYTHPIATGTFNRCYKVRRQRTGLGFEYEAPDAPGGTALFEKSVTFGAREFEVAVRSSFRDAKVRGQELTSFALPAGSKVLRGPNGYAIFEPADRRVVMVAWPAADVASSTFETHAADVLLTVTYAPGGVRHTRYAFAGAATQAQAQARFAAFANRR